MTTVLAIGTYSDTDRAALENELAPVFANGPGDIAALPEDQRRQIRALTFMGHHPLGGAEMDLLPNLGLIANFGVGYDAIDVAAATARGIKVTNTPDVLNDDVADLAVALLIAQGRQMLPAADWVSSGNWAARGNFGLARKVSGGRAGIVGLGRIGRAIANRLAAFDMEIHYTSRREKETPGWTYHADPVSLAEAVDYLIVALVGGPETENHVSKEVIAALGPRGIIVNISRGSTIDEAALLDALESGAIAGAGLDVFLNEPDIDPRFLKLDNVVLQPHQGSATVETRAAMGQLQRDNARAFLNGDALLTPVN
ncbi:2-hydroxyacid dehydrogenase [Actibacterium sp. MT2.3-13A]|uniref:2-hydroxyacid dehydrogenase n=1 Tax=Actibacterium sp. MT2.3-13A TaxID=2828332 RepID=UPI001BA80D0A|nr:2-hydroxyacid dehydrogenase [Actibacterium sp. MT2.3-13A]